MSDLIAKAGGVTPDAYIKGARLIRRMIEEEFRRKEDALRMAQAGGGDSISVKRLDLSDTYSVGINLGEALKILVQMLIWCFAREMYYLFRST